ncbi:Metallo-hydrolase/oxidoreductase, partial [Cylindrobasidium torrendii FP15055 ss-10]
MPSTSELGIPAAGQTVDVKAINVGGTNTLSPSSFFVDPVVPGNDGAHGAVYSFLIEHPSHGRLLFDLGYRVDEEGFSPAVQGLIGLWKSMSPLYIIEPNSDVATRLKDGGVPLDTIKAVIWSHNHLDHTGDMSTFPPSTDLIVGPGTDMRTYPQHADAILVESDTAGRKVIELSFDHGLKIGDLDALDYFGDGSLYILNTPGHHPGHISALARTTPTTFALLGGDCCHHPGHIRPTVDLHASCPCPGHILEAVKDSVSATHFTPHGADSKFDLANRTEPMFELPKGLSVYTDIKEAATTLKKVAKFDACVDVLFLIAHDSTTPEVVPEFPERFNDWKEKGYKEKLTWRFIEKESRAFLFGDK